MRNKLGNICIILGTALMLGALSLFLYNRGEARSARRASGEHLNQLVQTIHAAMPDFPEGEEENMDWLLQQVLTPSQLLTEEDVKMTETVIDGQAYIGFLSIPALNLELPILSDWDYTLLNIAPCRYSGTVLGEDLVLMAHNYDSHFGTISRLREGDSVSFVDADGFVTHYRVVGQDVLPPDAVSEMTAGVFDLTLFTCTYGGKSRITVYCDRVS